MDAAFTAADNELCLEVGSDICVLSNTTNFCASLDSTALCPTNQCVFPGAPAAFLSWVSQACPSDKQKSDASTREEAYHHLVLADSFRQYPSCVAQCQGITNLYNSSLYQEYVPMPGYNLCEKSKLMVNTTTWCSGLLDPKTCAEACTSAHEPRDAFTWLNKTCAQEPHDMESWRGATLAKESAWAYEWIPSLFPWSWTVKKNPQPPTLETFGIQITDPATSTIPYISVPPSGPGLCPASTSEKLGVFAAVNIVSALLIPVLGRRTVVRKLTFGLGGTLGSRAWALMGVLSACLHLCANLINAYIIRSTPGYEHVPFVSLALLWCTRPRLSWLAVFLAGVECEDGMYFNSAASAITSEAILQVIGAVYFGITANYGRQKRFYYVGHLGPYPRGRDALLMYAGALVWLVMLIYTLVGCVVCIVGLNTWISNARKMTAEVQKVAGAGANAIRGSFLAKWIPKRFQSDGQYLGPAMPPRKLTPEETQGIEMINFGLAIFIAFLAQWLFWAGYIRTARERCGPFVRICCIIVICDILDIVHLNWPL
jgi:hypothetical protein